MAHETTWFFIADRSRAIVFEATRKGLKAIHDFDEPAVRAHTSELMTGSRGRRSDTGHGRSAMDRQTSVQQTEVDRFVHSIGEWLHLQADESAFDDLILVAGPQMLGEMRDTLTTPVQHKLVDTLDKNYVHLAKGDIENHLREHFANHMPDRRDTIPTGSQKGNQQPTA